MLSDKAASAAPDPSQEPPQSKNPVEPSSSSASLCIEQPKRDPLEDEIIFALRSTFSTLLSLSLSVGGWVSE